MLKVKKINIFKYINKNHIFSRFVFIGIILFPSKSLNFLGGFPIKSFPKFIFIFFVFFLIFKIDSISKNHFVIFFLILVFKISTPFIFDNVWNVCVSDNTTPRQTQFEYIYIERDCVKSFDSLNNSQTLEVSKIEYGVIFDEYKWMGHNATNFPVGFLNHSAFNFYEKRRDWLPFKINLQKDLDELSEYVGLIYGFSAGYGNTSYNDEQWSETPSNSNNDAGWTDFNFYVNASYEVSDTLTAAASLNYMSLNGSTFENAANDIGYQANQILWGAVNLAYDF